MEIHPIANHATLPDMPSAANTDHDGRYYTETEVDTGFLAIDGSNANTTINIGSEDFTTMGLGAFGSTTQSGGTTFTGTTFPVGTLTRYLGATNNGTGAAFALIAQTSQATIVDGFGGGLAFRVKDTAGTSTNVAIYSVRDGADNSGKLVIRPYLTGSAQQVFAFTKEGYFGAGKEDPTCAVDAVGDITLSLDLNVGRHAYITGNLTAATVFTNGILIDGPEALAIETVTGNTTLDNTHSTLLVNASGNVTVTLPTAASAYNNTDGIGRIYEIKKIDADADTVTIDGNGAELIDGAATAVLTVQWESITIQSNGTSWYIL